MDYKNYQKKTVHNSRGQSPSHFFIILCFIFYNFELYDPFSVLFSFVEICTAKIHQNTQFSKACNCLKPRLSKIYTA